VQIVPQITDLNNMHFVCDRQYSRCQHSPTRRP